MNKLRLFFSATFLFSTSQLSADELVDQLQQCRMLTNPSARLACYDTTIASSVSQKPSTLEAPLVSSVKTQAVTTETLSEDSKTPMPSTQSALLEQKFGIENRKVTDNTIDEITSVITEITKSPRGDLTFSLANGQIWRQNGTETFLARVGNEVRVRRGALDSFLMNKVGSSKSVRVKRVD